MASKLRLLALLYYFAVTAVGVLVSVWISSVHRAPLPREDIERLAEFFPAPNRNFPNLWSKDALEISADPKAFDAEVLGSFSLALSDALGGTSVRVGRLRDEGPLGPCVHEASSTTACLEALEAEALSDAPLSASFELVLVKADSNALILGTGRRAFLWWRGRSVKDTAASTASLLKESWFRGVSFDGGASLFEITPGYVFSFFLLGDCASRISWDFFHAVLMPYLSRILGKLRILFDIEWNSQVVLCGSLGNSLEPSERGQKQAGNVVDVSLLQADFMRRTGEWPPDALTRDARWLPPLVRFVAFKPTESVQLVDEEGESRQSFAVQGFGAVAIAQCETGEASNSSSLSDCEARGVASGWISSVRSWLSLPADGSLATGEASLELLVARPRIDGIADWELQILARAAHAHFVQRTAETLRSLVELVDSLPDVVVREEIAAMAFQAVAKTRASIDAASQGDVTSALAESREALVLALTAIHDDSVVSQLYFSWEFKYAVYLPISMPILVPLVTACWRQVLAMFSGKRLVKRG